MLTLHSVYQLLRQRIYFQYIIFAKNEAKIKKKNNK